MTDTPHEFAVKMAKLAAETKTMEIKVTRAAATVVKQQVQLRVLLVVPSGRLRNVGKRGTRVGVTYKIVDGNTAVVKMFGPAQLIERDTQKHRIPRETVGRGKRKRANTKVVFIPGVGARAYVNHPGTKGKHPFERGVATALPAIPVATAKIYFAPIQRMF